MPVHAGHLAMIRFAEEHCDELIVSMSHTPDDPIPGDKRFAWLQSILQDNRKIKPHLVTDDFDDESLPWLDRTEIWAAFLKSRYGKIDVLVSSEEYGTYLAAHLGAVHVLFDEARKRVPVSATAIRLNPLNNWKYIPDVVKPYFVRKICFYGPESTGKSFLSRQLAAHYQTEVVPEVARELITSNDFTLADIIRIGQAQTDRVIQKTKTANKILFCDTDLITTQIYSRHYLHEVPPILFELEKQVTYDLYFLFDVDVPWVADGMRDLKDSRTEMLGVFRSELVKRKIDYKLVTGTYQQREQFVRAEIDKLLLQ